MDHSDKVIKTKEVIDSKVYNRAKEKLGEIEEIVLDKATGRVAYVVLAIGNFLGMSGKYFAVPWYAFEYDRIENCYILDADKATIKNAYGFDKNNWPDIADKTFAKTLSESEIDH